MSDRWFVVHYKEEGSGSTVSSYASGRTWYSVVERSRTILGTRFIDVSPEIELSALERDGENLSVILFQESA